MVEESVLRPLFDLLDQAENADAAQSGIIAILEQQAEKAPIIRSLISYLADDTSLSTKYWVFTLGIEHAPGLPEVIELALVLSRADPPRLRKEAMEFLMPLSEDARIRARFIEMLGDGDSDLRNTAIGVVSKMDHSGTQEGQSPALYVISSPTAREEALKVLKELETAIHKLRDVGDLKERQVAVVDEIMVPAINDLKGLFGAALSDPGEQLNSRKLAVRKGSVLIGAVMAAAKGAESLGKAGPAYERLQKAAEALTPQLDSVSEKLH